VAKPWAKKFYKSKEWQNERAYILRRDHYLCTEPNCYNPATEVHHIIELTPGNIDDPRVSLNESNLRSLCHDCHQRITKAEKASERSGGILPPIRWVDGYPVEINQ
jgi:5-methylcytosine-specific restriction endonuclease McrA